MTEERAGIREGGADVRALIRQLPRYQLHVHLGGLCPYVMPFDGDPNATGAFVKWADLDAVLALQRPPQETP